MSSAIRQVLVGISAGGLIVAALWAVTDSKEARDCIHNRKEDHAYHQLHDGSSSLIVLVARVRLHIACGFVAAGANEGALTGLSGIAVAGFTATLWWVTRRAVKATEAAAAAAQAAADASLLALDRPQLFINTPIHNGAAWIKGGANLTVVCSFTNHGKAPAIVHSIKGSVFLAPNPRNRLDELPPGMIDGINIFEFPEIEALSDFKRRWEREPSDSATPLTIEFGKFGDGPKTTWASAYATPLIIGGGETSDRYLIRGKEKLTPVQGAAPPQAVCSLYFIGTILYRGLDGDPLAIDFCYESVQMGPFKAFRGAPYNQRRKAYSDG